MNMRRKFLALLVAPAFLVSFGWSDWETLLTEEDFERAEAQAIAGPALSGPVSESQPTPEWESYNEWNCFPTLGVEFECTEVDYGGLAFVPTLRVRQPNRFIDFSMDPEPDADCGATLSKWEVLLEDTGGFCVLAAHLHELEQDQSGPRFDVPWSLWIVSELKTGKGYWP